MAPFFHATPSLLTVQRLDPYFYEPRFIEHAKRIRARFKGIQRIGEVFKVLDGTHDSVETKRYSNEVFSIPFLRSQDIGDGLLKCSDGAFLSRDDHYGKCRRSQIKRGDILLNIMATTGEACFFSELCPPEANANRAVGILR